MPTVGSITKTVRINPTDLVLIEGLMSDGTSWSGAIHKLCANYSKKPTPSSEFNEDTLEDLRMMMELSGGTVSDAIEALDTAMNDGLILFDDGRLIYELPEWAERIREACHDRCVSEEDLSKKIVEMINRV